VTTKAAKEQKSRHAREQEQDLTALISFRRPKQERGIKKFEAILDGADKLILSQGIHNFSLYDIAENASVAVGSVYHFFPSIEAVFAALVERYDREFTVIVSENIPHDEVDSWADIIWHHIEKSRQYINTHEQVLIMILGPGQTWQTRLVDTVGDTAIARAMLTNITEFFDIPDSPDPAELLHYAIRILESIWQLSYQRHGQVTEEMQNETYRAMCAYLELYWPRFIQRKNQTSSA
jgi:AcrR family transcriptional regulator